MEDESKIGWKQWTGEDSNMRSPHCCCMARCQCRNQMGCASSSFLPKSPGPVQIPKHHIIELFVPFNVHCIHSNCSSSCTHEWLSACIGYCVNFKLKRQPYLILGKKQQQQKKKKLVYETLKLLFFFAWKLNLKHKYANLGQVRNSCKSQGYRSHQFPICLSDLDIH